MLAPGTFVTVALGGTIGFVWDSLPTILGNVSLELSGQGVTVTSSDYKTQDFLTGAVQAMGGTYNYTATIIARVDSADTFDDAAAVGALVAQAMSDQSGTYPSAVTATAGGANKGPVTPTSIFDTIKNAANGLQSETELILVGLAIIVVVALVTIAPHTKTILRAAA